MELAELDQDGPAIAQMGRRVSVDDEEPVDHGEGLGPVFSPRVDTLEISEHPHDDLNLRRRGEVVVGELHGAPDGARRDRFGFGSLQNTAATERVEDQQLAGLVMWVPGGLVYMGAALALAAVWLSESETHARRWETALLKERHS